MNSYTIHNENCLDSMNRMSDNSIDSIVTDPPYGLKFMSKKWDYDVPSVAIWKECLRVLKPGGYLLSFAGTRTQHRMAVNIEDAGFEIRDMIAWVYGSGFPKSHNIGKAVDKLQGNERESLGVDNSLSRKDGREGSSMSRQQGQTGEVTKGTTKYEGWGTALKPALEPITVARKPLSEKTVAKNVLKYGTGGINIDGCRIALDGDYKCKANGRPSQTGLNDNYIPEEANQRDTQGRFPANFIHDGSQEVLDLFPHSKSGAMRKPYEYTNNGYSLGAPAGSTKQIHEASEGSASRFFYCAKTSKKERNEGLEDFPDKKSPRRDDGQPLGMNTSTHRPDGSIRNEVAPKKNNHPTVKPIALMSYLCRLVTPADGLIYDPFMGSGSTGKAAKIEGFSFIGSELSEDYFNIAKSRLGKSNN